MHSLVQFFSQHPFIATGITTYFANYGVSAFINALETPDETSSKFYRYVFRLGHIFLSQNPSRAFVEHPAAEAAKP